MAVAIGPFLALVGVIDGVVMIVKRHESPCPDGTYFPPGTTDITCYAQPRATLGIAVIVISLMLGILIALVGATVATVPPGDGERAASP